MKNYNFKKAKELIEQSKDCIKSASLGMHEDWFWTAETIWEDGKYTKELSDTPEELYTNYIKRRKEGMSLLSDESDNYKSVLIAGIYGSSWATPTLELQFNDGERQMIPCYCGESDRTNPDFELGCISSEVQNNIPPLKDIE